MENLAAFKFKLVLQLPFRVYDHPSHDAAAAPKIQAPDPTPWPGRCLSRLGLVNRYGTAVEEAFSLDQALTTIHIPLPAVRRASGDGARIKELSRCSRAASEPGLACSASRSKIFQQIRSTPRQLPAPAGFTGGLPGRVPPAAAASLGSGCELAPRRGHLRDDSHDKIDRRAIAAIFLGSLL